MRHGAPLPDSGRRATSECVRTSCGLGIDTTVRALRALSFAFGLALLGFALSLSCLAAVPRGHDGDASSEAHENGGFREACTIAKERHRLQPGLGRPPFELLRACSALPLGHRPAVQRLYNLRPKAGQVSFSDGDHDRCHFLGDHMHGWEGGFWTNLRFGRACCAHACDAVDVRATRAGGDRRCRGRGDRWCRDLAITWQGPRRVLDAGQSCGRTGGR